MPREIVLVISVLQLFAKLGPSHPRTNRSIWKWRGLDILGFLWIMTKPWSLREEDPESVYSLYSRTSTSFNTDCFLCDQLAAECDPKQKHLFSLDSKLQDEKIKVLIGKTTQDNVPVTQCTALRQCLWLLLSFCGSSTKTENLILIPRIP